MNKYFYVSVAISVAACGGNSNNPSADGQVQDAGLDTGTSRDGGSSTDSGTRDTGTNPVMDSGVVTDSGVVVDGNVITDGGVVVDGNVITDGGVPTDAGTTGGARGYLEAQTRLFATLCSCAQARTQFGLGTQEECTADFAPDTLLDNCYVSSSDSVGGSLTAYTNCLRDAEIQASNCFSQCGDMAAITACDMQRSQAITVCRPMRVAADERAFDAANNICLFGPAGSCPTAATPSPMTFTVANIAGQGNDFPTLSCFIDFEAQQFAETGSDVSFAWIAPSTGTFSVASSSSNVGIAVRTTCAETEAGDLACGLPPGENVGATVRFAATQGMTYFFVIDTPANPTQMDAVTLTVTALPPDMCPVGAAVSTLGPAVFMGSTEGSLNDFERTTCDGASFVGVGAPDVVHAWTAPSTGTFRIDTIGSNFDTVLEVRPASCDASMAALVCNDDASSRQSSVNFAATGGTTYYIVVDGFSGTAAGNYVVNINELVPPS